MSAADALAVLSAGTAQIVPEGGLAEKLGLGRPLRVKLGIDPTAADVTLGWAVVLRKLRQFQDAGHTAVLIVGDFTARVGDPSEKSYTRPRLPKDVVLGYADRLLGQFRKILSDERLEVRRNSEWLAPMGVEDVLRLTASYTVARMLERDDFASRYASGTPISIMEFMYPLFQGMDSVAVASDIELGGNDQLFNNLVGRELQRDHGQEPQVVVTMPLLEGIDGVQKMSQSAGNYVGIDEPADQIFGKLMSIPDALISKYLLLCTDVGPDESERVAKGIADGSLHGGEAKRRMAREIVDLYHGEGSGATAEASFNQVFREHETPTNVPELSIPPATIRGGKVWLPRILVAAGLAASNAEGRRLIEQGALRLAGERVVDLEREFGPEELDGKILQVGNRRFVRLRA